MRIIGGEKKGLVLSSIKGDWIRPTSDKIRGAIFSSVLNYIDTDSIFVDCFSGSGAMSIEALSRGFKTAYLFDKNKKSIEIIKANLKKAQYLKHTHIYQCSALEGLKKLEKDDVIADFIFMDPPYKKINLVFELLEYINQKNLLSPHGIIVIEHDKSDIINQSINYFHLLKEKSYGNTTITMLTNE